MEETNQSAHPPSSPPTHHFIEINLHAALLIEISVCFNLCLMPISNVCSFVIMQLSFPDCGQLLPRQHLVFHVVARRSTGALQQNRNESAAHGSLFISGCSWICRILPQNKKIRSCDLVNIVLHCDIIMTFFKFSHLITVCLIILYYSNEK